jgi:nitrilase
LRARAIETQCWIAASATWGTNIEAGHARATFGHSIICDPWGHIVSSVSDGTGWATSHIDRKLTAQIRARMPVLSHRAAWETSST